RLHECRAAGTVRVQARHQVWEGKMKAHTAVASAIIAAATVMLASVPAEATHKPNCGKRIVVQGFFFDPKGAFKARHGCQGRLRNKAEALLGSAFLTIEKVGAGCILQEAKQSKYWCVCSGEPCWKPYSVKPGKYDFKINPFPPGRDLSAP